MVYQHKYYILLQNLTTCHYNSHLHAYEVDFCDSFTVKMFDELADVHPLSLVRGFGKYSSGYYVVLKYEVMPTCVKKQ